MAFHSTGARHALGQLGHASFVAPLSSHLITSLKFLLFEKLLKTGTLSARGLERQI